MVMSCSLATPVVATPCTPRSASDRLVMLRRASSSPEMTEMLAGASAMFCSNPDAVITISSSRMGAVSWANAGAVRAVSDRNVARREGVLGIMGLGVGGDMLPGVVARGKSRLPG